jgi:hypothetical protein
MLPRSRRGLSEHGDDALGREGVVGAVAEVLGRGERKQRVELAAPREAGKVVVVPGQITVDVGIGIEGVEDEGERRNPVGDQRKSSSDLCPSQAPLQMGTWRRSPV